MIAFFQFFAVRVISDNISLNCPKSIPKCSRTRTMSYGECRDKIHAMKIIVKVYSLDVNHCKLFKRILSLKKTRILMFLFSEQRL